MDKLHKTYPHVGDNRIIMKEENRLLIIWVIFGFVFIKSIDSILYFLSNLIMTVEILLNISFLILKYSYATITVFLYLLTTIIIIKKLKATSELNGIYLTQFPKKTFLILSVIAIILPGLSNYLTGTYTFQILDEYIEINNLTKADYFSIYGFYKSTLILSNFAMYISLIVGFFYLLKRKT